MSVKYTSTRENQKFSRGRQITALLRETMTRVIQPALVKRFEELTKDWEHDPAWVGTESKSSDGMIVWAKPTQNVDIYTYNTLGTKPHKIKPKNARVLAFQWGGQQVFTKEVDHPGTKAKNFEEKVAKEFKPEYDALMKAAFRRIIQFV